MEEFNEAYSIWISIIEQTVSAGQPLEFPKEMDNGKIIPSPDETKPKILTRHIGEPKWQIADWRASFTDSKKGFHAVEFEDRYETHIDSVDPLKDPLNHLIKDSPKTLVGIISAIVVAGGIVGYAFMRKK